MGGAGNDYDFNPPSESETSKGGRPPEKLDKAVAFLVEKLTESDRKQCDLVKEWEAVGESKGTLFNAFRAMQDDGRVVIDDCKPKVCRLVKNFEDGQQFGS